MCIRDRCRAAFFQAQRRELHRRCPPSGHHRTGSGGVAFLPGAADRRAAKRRRQHRRGQGAGRGGADRASGTGQGLIGAAAPFALFPACGWADSPRNCMADKRTTPETPAGAQPDAPQDAGSGPRRKKRAAPTIDLTATEMPSPPHAAAPPPRSDPPPAPAQEPPAEARSGGPISLATLAAGVAGAATVALVLAALWLAGLLPVRTVTSTDTGAHR